MSEKKITITGDDMLETQLRKNSEKLNISVNELIDRYIKRAIYREFFYVHKPLTWEEWKERSRKNVEKDKKRGIQPCDNTGMDDIFIKIAYSDEK